VKQATTPIRDRTANHPGLQRDAIWRKSNNAYSVAPRDSGKDAFAPDEVMTSQRDAERERGGPGAIGVDYKSTLRTYNQIRATRLWKDCSPNIAATRVQTSLHSEYGSGK
jgi:hypothetical protein